MKGKLLEVPLNELHPNPFRDEKRFPLRERRVAQLQESIEAEGFWEGVIARKADGDDYEIAFGHHRVEAARRVLGKSAEIPVIVKDLDESDMVRLMERENIADGLGFYYTTVQVVAGAVKALGDGKIKRGSKKGEWPEEEREYSRLRVAPSFVVSDCGSEEGRNGYSVVTLARFLGATHFNKDRNIKREQASVSIELAVAVLEMMERGYITPADCAQLETQAQFETIVQTARINLKAKEEKESADIRVLEEARARYAKEQDSKGVTIPNKAKIEKVEQQIKVVKKLAEKPVVGMVRRAVKDVVDRFASGSSVKEVRQAVIQPIKQEFAQHVKATLRSATLPAFTISEVESLARRYDGIAKEDERMRAIKCKNKAAKEALAESVKRLQARLRGYSTEGL